ncbi:hypothetical protein [Peribacillus simplex]|uniref:hypothetical protein n=1 Tax=Peribacillus simplex TaxID=1478 RepID=UPI002853733B|nr:hypothetical protein [Peribacillus simplex]MDR4925950.1 hypothetical protein [Peribacillus simplex]
MKNVFSYNADIEKNAYLNWRTNRNDHIHNMIVLADGFMSAATLLAKQVLLDNVDKIDNVDKKTDSLIFPILFNANHGIEVYLKAISWSLNILNNTGERFDPYHKLNKLLEKNISLVNTFENDSEKLKTLSQ